MVRELWATLRRFWLLLLTIAVLGGAASFVRSVGRPTFYDAVGKIELTQNGRAGMSGRVLGKDDPGTRFSTAMAVISGDRILASVVEDLDLAHNTAFLGTRERAQGEWTPQQLAIFRLRHRLQVNVVPYTNIVRIDFVDSDPQLAASTVDTLIDEFVTDRLETQNRLRSRANRILNPRLEELQDAMVAAQTHMLQLRQQLKSPDYNPRNNQLAETLAKLALQLAEARLTLLTDESQLRAVLDRQRQGTSDEMAATRPSASEPEATFAMSRRLSDARMQQAQIAALAGPRNPELLAAEARTHAIEDQRAAQARELVEALKAKAAISRIEVEQLTHDLDQQTSQAAQLAPLLGKYSDLQREYSSSRTIFDRFARRLRIAPANLAYRNGMIQIVGRASVYKVNTGRALPKQILYDATMSLLAATLFLFLARYLYWPSLKAEGFESLTGQLALAVIPRLKTIELRDVAQMLSQDLSDGGAPAVDNISPDFLEGLFDLRQELEAGPRSGRPRCILLTSARPSEGKTTIVTSLAIVMARQGRRVLLVDADLRRPTVGKRLHLTGRRGLSDVLNGLIDIEHAVQTVPGAPTLEILTSGPIPPDPVKLLESRQMQELLEDSARRYEFILIDAPPVLPVTDAVLLAQKVDAVVWVVRANRWQRLALWRAGELLSIGRVPLRGIVVNGIDRPQWDEEHGSQPDLMVRFRQWQSARSSN